MGEAQGKRPTKGASRAGERREKSEKVSIVMRKLVFANFLLFNFSFVLDSSPSKSGGKVVQKL